MATTISDAPRRLRIAAPKGEPKVDRENKIIHGFSVITRGEALGHRLWIDQHFIEQTAKAGNKAKAGIKARFTHPGLSGDGMGKQIGRAKNFRVEGERVLADLHLYKESNQDYVENVINLAEEDPKAFGASIVFSEDIGEMGRFRTKHTDKDGKFTSPDPDNTNGYDHARLAELHAVDAVDEPAANPDGLFSFPEGSELAARAEGLLAYALGLTEDAPPEMAAGPHPERARTFVSDFLERHGLEVVEREAAPAPEPELTAPQNVSNSRVLHQRQRQYEAEHSLATKEMRP
jgi:hypothetical protein